MNMQAPRPSPGAISAGRIRRLTCVPTRDARRTPTCQKVSVVRTETAVAGVQKAILHYSSTDIRGPKPYSSTAVHMLGTGSALLSVLQYCFRAALRASHTRQGSRLEASEHRQPQFPQDAFDIYRLLRAIGTAELAEEFRLLQAHEISSRVTSQALSKFQDLFGARSDRGPELLVSHIGPLEDTAFIVESSVTLSQDLLEAIAQQPLILQWPFMAGWPGCMWMKSTAHRWLT